MCTLLSTNKKAKSPGSDGISFDLLMTHSFDDTIMNEEQSSFSRMIFDIGYIDWKELSKQLAVK